MEELIKDLVAFRAEKLCGDKPPFVLYNDGPELESHARFLKVALVSQGLNPDKLDVKKVVWHFLELLRDTGRRFENNKLREKGDTL